MHNNNYSFVKIYYVFMMIIWAAEQSEQGAACLNYGHSCWGAHGKRNGELSNSPNAWFYRMAALMMKSANKESPIDQSQTQDEEAANNYNVFKTIKQRSSKRENSDDTIDPWNIQPSRDVQNGRYYRDQVFDPKLDKLYKLIMNI